MANYLDLFFQKIIKGLSEQDIEKKLKPCMLIIEWIASKDRFIQKYQYLLSLRLLLGRCSDIEAEKRVLQKIKESTQNIQMVEQLYKMINDI